MGPRNIWSPQMMSRILDTPEQKADIVEPIVKTNLVYYIKSPKWRLIAIVEFIVILSLIGYLIIR